MSTAYRGLSSVTSVSTNRLQKTNGAPTPSEVLAGASMNDNPTDPDKGHVCPSCGKECSSEHGLKVHYGRMSDEEHPGSISDNKFECEVCGRTSIARDSRDDPSHCSQLCYSVAQSEADSVQEYARARHSRCKWCDEWDTVPPGDVNTFCSIECRSEWRKAQENLWGGPTVYEHTCPECEEVFEARQEDRTFCSFSCRSKYHARNRDLKVDGNPRYEIPIPDERRFEVYVRDAGRCQRCGLTIPESLARWGKSLDIHHIRPRSEIMKEIDSPADARRTANDLDNLVTLCARCHGIVEHTDEGV